MKHIPVLYHEAHAHKHKIVCNIVQVTCRYIHKSGYYAEFNEYVSPLDIDAVDNMGVPYMSDYLAMMSST